jgi:hypothetical protein
METRLHAQPKAAPSASFISVRGAILQRKCAYGGTRGLAGECEERRRKRQPRLGSRLGPSTINHHPSSVSEMPLIVHEVLSSPGQALDTEARASTEPRFGHDFTNVAVFSPSAVTANLPLPEKNLLPGTEPSADGTPQSGVQLGPLASVAPAGAGGVAAPNAPSVFYISFQNVAPPTTPDHSRMSPGPAGTLSNNAGFTQAVLGARMIISWDAGPAQGDGHVPIFFRSVNIFYRLDPIKVFVSSQYATGSCPFRVTWAHEQEHVEAFTRLFHAGRDTLVAALSSIPVPTETAPRLVDPANVAGEQTSVENALSAAVQTHKTNLKAQMDADRQVRDSPSSYSSVYARCPAADW